jgi:hypothetical protein
MRFSGRELTRTELLDAVGDADQLGGVTAAVFADGPAAGSRMLSVRSPGGLSFVVLPDRGLDLGWADHRGVPLAWRSPAGDVGPAHAEPAGAGWLRTFGGGLFTTCGLSSVGQPSTDAGEELGLHGRYSSLPAREVAWSTEWCGDERVVTVSGRVREASALGPVLELRRTVTTVLGRGSLRLQDVVINLGADAAPHMFRYHVNLGFPLVDQHSRIDCAAVQVAPRDDASAVGLPTWQALDPPSPPVAEQVFTVTPAGEGDRVTATLCNPVGRPSLRLSWSRDTLPLLVVWKQPTRRTYVTALEPSNCHDDGRAAERARGTLVELAPGEERRYTLDLEVVDPGTSTEG